MLLISLSWCCSLVKIRIGIEVAKVTRPLAPYAFCHSPIPFISKKSRDYLCIFLTHNLKNALTFF
ncbi:hypothetical protein [Salmonella phage SD-6_S16]|nr:hypothetical protein [Salmonella phage SD-6_S16]